MIFLRTRARVSLAKKTKQFEMDARLLFLAVHCFVFFGAMTDDTRSDHMGWTVSYKSGQGLTTVFKGHWLFPYVLAAIAGHAIAKQVLIPRLPRGFASLSPFAVSGGIMCAWLFSFQKVLPDSE
jgi:hypothetical protein